MLAAEWMAGLGAIGGALIALLAAAGAWRSGQRHAAERETQAKMRIERLEQWREAHEKRCAEEHADNVRMLRSLDRIAAMDLPKKLDAMAEKIDELQVAVAVIQAGRSGRK